MSMDNYSTPKAKRQVRLRCEKLASSDYQFERGGGAGGHRFAALAPTLTLILCRENIRYALS
jgi:hypothetical protein